MVIRGSAAGFIVIFCLALMLVPNETFGRSGGGVSGRSSSSPSASHSSTSHSSTIGRPPIHAIARSLHHQHQRNSNFSGFPIVPGYYGSGYYGYGSYYMPWDAPHRSPSIEIGVNPPPSNAQPEKDVTGSISERYQVYVYRRGCPSEAVTVPWDDGKENSVNIVRC